MSENKERWHIGKEIPIAFILAIAIQTIGGIWWLSSVESRISNLEKHAPVVDKHTSQIAVLEAQGANIRHDLSRMEVKIDRLLERK